MNINRVIHEIKYAYARMEAFNEYYDVNSLLLETALNNVLDQGEMLADMAENGETGVQRSMKKLSDYVKGERQVVNGLKGEENVLPLQAVEILESIKAHNIGGIIYISFPLKGEFNLTVKKQRGAVFTAEGISINPDENRFMLLNPMAIYGNEDYSIAFAASDGKFGFALMYGPSIIGAKGKNMLKVSYFDQKAYYIDDAAKYRDVSQFGIL